tara:strand:+ start:83 stop:472 length:390 start_codon:yes stop_codon:yes gene_type:complete
LNKNILQEIRSTLSKTSENKKLPGYLSGLKAESVEIPLSAVIPRSSWEKCQAPAMLRKVFRFDNLEQQKFFLTELMDYQDQMHHHADINISEANIEVMVYTRDLNCITELDYELSRVVDMIFADAQGVS